MINWKKPLMTLVLAGLAFGAVPRPAAAQFVHRYDGHYDRWHAAPWRGYRTGYGVPNGYYNPYPPAVASPVIADPYGGYLAGAASAVSAQGQYLINTQQANLLKQQVQSATIANRRQAFDENLYENANTPTANDIRIQQQTDELQRALTNPPQTEIWSAKTLNDLLANAQQMEARGVEGPEVALNGQMLKDINVSVNQQGNVGALKNAGKLQWPLALRKLYPPDQSKALRDQIDQLTLTAKNQAAKGQVDAQVLTDLEQSIDKLTQLLKDRVDSTAFADYTAAKHFLKDLDQSVAVLKQPDAGKYVSGAYAARGSTVNELVNYMSQNGLKFAPATSGEEGAYSALYQSLLRYTLGSNAMTAVSP
jgi:hypothetical protein